MLRTNLSTRPFYNSRAVNVLLAAATVLVVAFTLFNATQITRLTVSQRSLGASAIAGEEEAARLRTEAAGIRAQINPTELQGVADAAREANSIIDRRAFSWTTLFAQFEATLPPEVRITAIRPRVQEPNVMVSVSVEARRAEDLDAFMEALEKSGDFFDVLPVQEQATDEGLLQAVVEGRYVPPPREGVAQ
jgi:Tfp pilus assembly protein PilN